MIEIVDHIDERYKLLYDQVQYWNRETVCLFQVMGMLMKKTSQLDNIIDLYRETGQVSLKDMARLLNLTELHDAHPEETRFIQVDRLDDNSISLEFEVIYPSQTTKVFRTDSFKYWDNLDTGPEYKKIHRSNLCHVQQVNRLC
jgi:hypothetical protein